MVVFMVLLLLVCSYCIFCMVVIENDGDMCALFILLHCVGTVE